MTWFRVDDNFPEHPKVRELSNQALVLWLKAGCWCSRYATSGDVPASIVRLYGFRPASAWELVSAGLWDKTDDGWRFHDWLDYNPSKSDIERIRAQNRERQRTYRERHLSKSNGVSNALSNARDNATPARPIHTTTFRTGSVPEGGGLLELVTSQTNAHASVSASSSFEAFWKLYPRKVGKKAAQAEWDRAVKSGVSSTGILDALRLQLPMLRDIARSSGMGLVPHPRTWLHQGRWDDEVTKASQNGWEHI